MTDRTHIDLSQPLDAGQAEPQAEPRRPAKPAILRPFIPEEAIGTVEAARRAGKKRRTAQDWGPRVEIARKVDGRLRFSQVAEDMYLAGDTGAHAAYLAGDRQSERVAAYYRRRKVPLPE